MAVSEEPEVLRQRLLAKESTLRNLSKKFLSFTASLESSTPEEASTKHTALLKEIAAYEFGVSKAHALIHTNTQQIDAYGHMHRSIEVEMKGTEDEIRRLAVQLGEERTLRLQREQYAALARRINQLPPRAQTQRELEELDSELAALKQEATNVEAKLELRSKRFAAFTHALHDLQQSEEADDDAPARMEMS